VKIDGPQCSDSCRFDSREPDSGWPAWKGVLVLEILERIDVSFLVMLSDKFRRRVRLEQD
jgi:hypothetical protein